MKTTKITKTTAVFMVNNSKALLPTEFELFPVRRFARAVERAVTARGEYRPLSQDDIRVSNDSHLFAIIEFHDSILLYKSEGRFS